MEKESALELRSRSSLGTTSREFLYPAGVNDDADDDGDSDDTDHHANHDGDIQADCTVLTEGAVQQGAIHRKQGCCNKHVPTVHDAEHVLECSKPNSDWFKRSGSKAARQQRSSAAAARRRGAELAACLHSPGT